MIRIEGLSIVTACLLALVGCSSNQNGEKASPPRQWNVTILLDLSDRIDPGIHPSEPSHAKRDIEAAGSVVDAFKQHMEDLGALVVKSKLRVLFSPNPVDPEINEIASKLAVDLTDMTPAQKKTTFDSLRVNFETGLTGIYELAQSAKRYPGADIWRFLNSDRAADYCVDGDTTYRDILIILTDGYLYHEESIERVGNKTTYLTGPFLQSEGIREDPNWRTKLEDGDYGFIASRDNLARLEVLVLEVDPAEGHSGDEDIIQYYWSNWLTALGTKRHKVVKTDLPQRIAPLISRFLKET